MSNRTLIELNHDLWDKMEGPAFTNALQAYLRSANKDNAEDLERFGVRVFGTRHHSEGFVVRWGCHAASEPPSK